MSSPTFHRVAALPKELQLQIWEHAAAPPTYKDIIDADFIFEKLEYLPLSLKTWTARKIYHAFILLLYDWHVFGVRRAMIQTCRTARLVAMKAWREEVMRFVLEEDYDRYYYEEMQEIQSELGSACELEVVKLRWRMRM